MALCWATALLPGHQHTSPLLHEAGERQTAWGALGFKSGFLSGSYCGQLSRAFSILRLLLIIVHR